MVTPGKSVGTPLIPKASKDSHDKTMTLPPVDTVPLLMMRFTPKASDKLISLVKERLQQRRVIITSEDKINGQIVLGLTTSQEAIDDEAQRCDLLKPTLYSGTSIFLVELEGTELMKPFVINEKEKFLNVQSSEKTKYSAFDNDMLFSSSDRVRLFYSHLEATTVLEVGETHSDLSQEMLRTGKHTEYLCDSLRMLNKIDVLSPVHINHVKDKVCQETIKFWTPTPVQGFCDYYGEEVALYFAWMDFYIKALLFPGLFGLIIWAIRTSRGDSIDNCTITPFHGLVTFIWAVVFVQLWERKQNRLAYSWGTWSATGTNKRSSVRHEFQGETRKSAVTGKMVEYYPLYRRHLKYLGSGIVTLFLLSGAFFMMILSLNLQGFIDNRPDPRRWGDDRHHPFYFSFVASFSEDGRLFDMKSPIMSLVPVIFHVLLVMAMNMGYSKIAVKLTEWENHEYEISHQNSLIVKRFFFEAFDAYLVLFYLAFYEQDINKVRSELVSVFNVDTFRRLLMEGIIPFIKQKIEHRANSRKADAKKKDDDSGELVRSSLVEQTEKDEYEQFDDFIEMIVQLGYVTLFASAYPCSGLFAIAANFIEIRLDAFKLCHICLRTRSIPRANIGTWTMLIKSIVWMSALTNCLIFSFSSMQMYQYLPKYFIIDEDGEHDLGSEGWVVVFIIFAIEHALILIGILISVAVPNVPNEILQKEQQKEYIFYHTTGGTDGKSKTGIYDRKRRVKSVG